MAKIAFITHGKLRTDKKLLQQIATAFAFTDELKFFFTERIYHAPELTKQAVAEGYQFVIGICGDGTLNEIVNGVIQSGNKEVVVGVIPHGSGNDFIKTLLPPLSLAELASFVQQNKFRVIDLMQAEFTGVNGKQTTRYSTNITDVGIGGVCAQKMHGSQKLLGATLTFQYHIITTFLNYRAQPVRVKADSFNYENEVMNFCVCNGKYFGAGLGVAPEANLQDGLLNVVAIGKVNLLDYLRNFPTIKKCERVNHPEVKYFTTAQIEIQSPEKNIPIDMDGELAGFLPMKIKVVPAAIRFLA